MITCKLQGGLGNQMFQIAATHALALRNNDVCGFNFSQCYTPLQGNPSNKYKDNIFAKITETNDYKFRVDYAEPRFGYEELPYAPELMLSGYFQSEKYFYDYKDEIKDLFLIDKSNVEDFIDSVRKPNLPVTSIHIRRGDYVGLSDMHCLCTLDYYNDAMSFIGDSIFVIISDDIEWAKENLQGDNIHYSPFENEIDDFTMMTCCDNNVIANSSFGWWGAYLNKNDNKKIIAPKTWFGPRGPKDTEDIIPINWYKR